MAVAADALASITNASVDTYDSGPSSIAMERWVVQVLAHLAGLGEATDGVLTPGGSMSNLLALMLARDDVSRRMGRDAREHGVFAMGRPVVLCSRVAHFSVHRACAALGLGEGAVIPVEVDAAHRMRVDEVTRILDGLAPDQTPVALMATAGTTDFGSVDPLEPLAAICRERNLWLHVDAAYGFGALFSERLQGRMKGIHLADSITLDLHKIGWQPAATSVCLVAQREAFRTLHRQPAYLMAADDAEAGYSGQLGLSLQTTRRADAVKVAATFLALGRQGLGDLVDTCHHLARHAQQRIEASDDMELVAPATLSTVVFRHVPAGHVTPEQLDALQAEIRRTLMDSGHALVGRTTVCSERTGGEPRVCLKFTFLNPIARPRDVDELLLSIRAVARIVEGRRADHEGPRTSKEPS